MYCLLTTYTTCLGTHFDFLPVAALQTYISVSFRFHPSLTWHSCFFWFDTSRTTAKSLRSDKPRLQNHYSVGCTQTCFLFNFHPRPCKGVNKLINPSIRFIIVLLIEKPSNSLGEFSVKCNTLLEQGITATPFCKDHRRIIWPMDFSTAVDM